MDVRPLQALPLQALVLALMVLALLLLQLLLLLLALLMEQPELALVVQKKLVLPLVPAEIYQLARCDQPWPNTPGRICGYNGCIPEPLGCASSCHCTTDIFACGPPGKTRAHDGNLDNWPCPLLALACWPHLL